MAATLQRASSSVAISSINNPSNKNQRAVVAEKQQQQQRKGKAAAVVLCLLGLLLGLASAPWETTVVVVDAAWTQNDITFTWDYQAKACECSLLHPFHQIPFSACDLCDDFEYGYSQDYEQARENARENLRPHMDAEHGD